MAWTKPEFSRRQVDGAGEILANPRLTSSDEEVGIDVDAYLDALTVINN